MDTTGLIKVIHYINKNNVSTIFLLKALRDRSSCRGLANNSKRVSEPSGKVLVVADLEFPVFKLATLKEIVAGHRGIGE